MRSGTEKRWVVGVRNKRLSKMTQPSDNRRAVDTRNPASRDQGGGDVVHWGESSASLRWALADHPDLSNGWLAHVRGGTNPSLLKSL